MVPRFGTTLGDTVEGVGVTLFPDSKEMGGTVGGEEEGNDPTGSGIIFGEIMAVMDSEDAFEVVRADEGDAGVARAIVLNGGGGVITRTSVAGMLGGPGATSGAFGGPAGGTFLKELARRKEFEEEFDGFLHGVSTSVTATLEKGVPWGVPCGEAFLDFFNHQTENFGREGREVFFGTLIWVGDVGGRVVLLSGRWRGGAAGKGAGRVGARGGGSRDGRCSGGGQIHGCEDRLGGQVAGGTVRVISVGLGDAKGGAAKKAAPRTGI